MGETTMKKTRRIICIITSLVTIMTMTSVGVFATEGMGADQPIMADETSDQLLIGEGSEAGAKAAAAQVKEDESKDVQPAADLATMKTSGALKIAETQIIPATPAVRAYSGFKAIKLTWDPVPNAEAYNVGMRNPDGSWVSLGVTRNYSIEKRGLETRTKYTFRVMAVRLKEASKYKTSLTIGDINGKYLNGNWTGEVSYPAYIYDKQCVNRLQISFTLKKTKNYAGVRMKKGTKVVSEGYGGGRYIFTNPKGRTATVGRISVRNPKASYIRKGGWNYSKADAEYFINTYMDAHKSAATKKKRMIWVSSYTQHLYIFEKTNGEWKATKWNWEVSMGAASTPTTTGNRTIKMIIGSRHGVGNWNVVSKSGDSYSALHGAKSSWMKKLGNLASHGCIRSKTSNAKIISTKCGKGTRVVIY